MSKIMLVFFVCNVLLADSLIIPQRVPSMPDAKNFFNYSEGMIVIPNFPIAEIAKKVKDEKIFKVPTGDLLKYNLKVGTIIQSVDLETGEKKPDFILREYVYGVLPSDQQDYERLRIVASYDEKAINSIKEIKFFTGFATGFSYVGTGRKFTSIKSKIIKPVDESKIGFNIAGWNSDKPGVKIKSLDLFGSNLYAYSESSDEETFKLVFRNAVAFYNLGVTDYFSNQGSTFLDWNNQRIMLIKRLSSDNCTELYLLSDKKVEMAPLSCK